MSTTTAHLEERLHRPEPLRRVPIAPDRVPPPADGSEQLPPRQTAYREFRPPAQLRDHVICYWHRQAGPHPSDARVLPDGCVDIIWVNDRPPVVAGPMTLSIRSAIEPETEIVGIRFRPGVAQQVLGVNAKELLNQHVPLCDFWPPGRHVQWEAAAAGKLITAKFAAISEVVAKRVTAIDETDAFVTFAAAWMAGHPSGRIEELSRLSGLSERQLRRRFDRAIGYGPKTLQRILRLQYLLWLASRHQHAGWSLARLAFAAGYADQSHMTREVVALTGTSPRHLLNGAISSAVSDLFKTATS